MTIEGYQSLPTRFGRLTGNIFDECPIYTFNISSSIIDQYLPDKLYAFTSTTCKSLAKRYVFYSKSSVHVTRRQLSENNQPLYDFISLSDLLKKLLAEKDSTIRYNFVIMDDCLIFIRVPSVRHISYYALCKHVTLTNRAKHVRFAGEMWCDEDNNLLLNNNSGTYRPSDGLIDRAIDFFDYLTPDLPFQGVSFRISAQPSMKHRFAKKVKRKLSLNYQENLV